MASAINLRRVELLEPQGSRTWPRPVQNAWLRRGLPGAPRRDLPCPGSVFALGARRSVDRQGTLEVLEDANVVHDDARLFCQVLDDWLCAMVCIRVWFFIGLSRYIVRASRHVEAGDPHGADEHQPERVVGSLNLVSRSSSCIRFRCGRMSRPFCFEVGDLVLRLADNHCQYPATHPDRDARPWRRRASGGAYG